MHVAVRFASFVLLGGLCSCATIVSGSSQRVAVDTSPEGADCRVSQGGVPVGEVQRTPGAVLVQRGAGMVQVSCAKPGYQAAQQADTSNINAWVFGNLVIGGLVGVVVDLATGSAYHYGPNVMVAMSGLPSYAEPPEAYRAMSSRYDSSAGTRSAAYVPSDDERFRAATGRALPADHGLILLPPATPNGDYTYMWPRSESN